MFQGPGRGFNRADGSSPFKRGPGAPGGAGPSGPVAGICAAIPEPGEAPAVGTSWTSLVVERRRGGARRLLQ